MSRGLLFVLLMLAAGLVLADDVPVASRDNDAVERPAQGGASEAEKVEGADKARARTKGDAKLIDGMSILGNQEAPKSLVIVPWKTSVLGESPGISTMLDDSRQPVDREVFMRALSYYEIRSKTRP
jgi:hypothetical protein